jgi:hypothetical protein
MSTYINERITQFDKVQMAIKHDQFFYYQNFTQRNIIKNEKLKWFVGISIAKS